MAELERTIDRMAGPDEELTFLGRGEKSLESAAKYLIERSLQECIENPEILGSQEELEKDLEGSLDRWRVKTGITEAVQLLQSAALDVLKWRLQRLAEKKFKKRRRIQ